MHDPILPLNIENDSVGRVKPVAAEIKEFLSGFDKLDISDFDKVF